MPAPFQAIIPSPACDCSPDRSQVLVNRSKFETSPISIANPFQLSRASGRAVAIGRARVTLGGVSTSADATQRLWGPNRANPGVHLAHLLATFSMNCGTTLLGWFRWSGPKFPRPQRELVNCEPDSSIRGRETGVKQCRIDVVYFDICRVLSMPTGPRVKPRKEALNP